MVLEGGGRVAPVVPTARRRVVRRTAMTGGVVDADSSVQAARGGENGVKAVLSGRNGPNSP